MRFRYLLAGLFFCTLAPAFASLSMHLNTAGVITAPTELSVDGVITQGGYQGICAALVSLKYDPTKLAITSVRAGGSGWTNEGTNNITDASVYLTLLTNIPAMQWSTGPMVYVTVSPVAGPVDTDDCGVLSIWGGGMDVDYASNLATETYDTVYVTGGCGGGDAIEEEDTEDDLPLITDAEVLDSDCLPDVGSAAHALFIAGGLMDSSPEDVLMYDLDEDGAVTVQDAVAILRACPRVTLPRTYYVSNSAQSANDVLHGSETAPWRTFSYALPRLFAGDTLNVRGGAVVNPSGDFVETVQPRLQPGTEADRITVQAYSDDPDRDVVEHPTLKGLLRLNKPDYWTFDGLNVTWPFEANPTNDQLHKNEHLIKVHGGRGWIYQNAEIWGARSLAAFLVGFTPSAGLPSGWEIRYNAIHDTAGVHDGEPGGDNKDHLLYVNTGVGAGPGLIERNILYNAENGEGIKLAGSSVNLSNEGAANVTVQYNTVYNTVQAILVGWYSHHNTIEWNLLSEVRSDKNVIRVFELFGQGNTAYDNYGYGGYDDMIWTSPEGDYTLESGRNDWAKTPGHNPSFVSTVPPYDFHPQNINAQAYGRYAGGQ